LIMTKIRTALVGSYAQPEWLIDREALRNRLPARILTGDMWKIPEEDRQEAMDDAVLSILDDQELAGIDILLTARCDVKVTQRLLPMPPKELTASAWKPS